MSEDRSTPLRTPSGTYRAVVGDDAFELAFEAGRLTLDGEEVAYRFEPVSKNYFLLRLEGRSVPAVVEPLPDGRLRVTIKNRQTTVRVLDEKDLLLERFGIDEGVGAGEREIRAPMPGLVLRVMVEPGQEIEAGQGLLVLEAMKMENELRAPAAGTVQSVHAAPGDAVSKDELLIELEA